MYDNYRIILLDKDELVKVYNERSELRNARRASTPGRKKNR